MSRKKAPKSRSVGGQRQRQGRARGGQGRARDERSARPAEAPLSEEQLQGPPPAEVLQEPTDLERAMRRESAEYSATSPKLTGGDPDADWQRAHLSGEEAVGGSAATPDQDIVDQLGDALGVSRGLEEEVRSSAEILEQRDARRGHNEE
jgi:hypothetical protein